jgi:hypothetical protein
MKKLGLALASLSLFISSCVKPQETVVWASITERDQAAVTIVDDERKTFRPHQIGLDGHLWEGKEWTHTFVSINVVEYKNYWDLTQDYKKVNGVLPKGAVLNAFTTYDGLTTCTLHIIDPDLDYRPEIIGHELMHCVHGDFHPNHLKRIGLEK